MIKVIIIFNLQGGRSISVLDRSVEQSWESFKKQTMRGLFTDETSPKADMYNIYAIRVNRFL